MRCIRRVLAGAFLTSLLSFAPLTAQISFEIAPFVGGAFALNDLSGSFTFGTVSFQGQKLEPALATGLYAGIRMSPRLSVEGTAMVSPSVITAPSTDLSTGSTETGFYNAATVSTFAVNVLLNFPGEGVLEPFVTGGIGVRHISGTDPFGGFDSPSNPAFNVGAGLRFKIHPSYAIRVDARDYISSFAAAEDLGDTTTLTQHDVVITFGISFY